MSLNRPFVLSTLEEDFLDLGIITESDIESEAAEEDEVEEMSTSKFKTLPKSKGGRTGTGKPGKNKGANAIDYGTEDEDDFEDDAVEEAEYAEAEAFHEEFQFEWEHMKESGTEAIYLDDEGMLELESCAEEVVELPGGFMDEDEEGEPDDDDSYRDMARALKSIESIARNEGTPVEDARPVFANVALIAEHLYGYFASLAEEEAEFESIARTYHDMAKYAAAAVDILGEDDDLDEEVIESTMREYVVALMEGLETFQILSEEDEEDEEEQEEADLGNDESDDE
jgi:hypothetical protein